MANPRVLPRRRRKSINRRELLILLPSTLALGALYVISKYFFRDQPPSLPTDIPLAPELIDPNIVKSRTVKENVEWIKNTGAKIYRLDENAGYSQGSFPQEFIIPNTGEVKQNEIPFVTLGLVMRFIRENPFLQHQYQDGRSWSINFSQQPKSHQIAVIRRDLTGRAEETAVASSTTDTFSLINLKHLQQLVPPNELHIQTLRLFILTLLLGIGQSQTNIDAAANVLSLNIAIALLCNPDQKDTADRYLASKPDTQLSDTSDSTAGGLPYTLIDSVWEGIQTLKEPTYTP